jgi:hypothetical protein
MHADVLAVIVLCSEKLAYFFRISRNAPSNRVTLAR